MRFRTLGNTSLKVSEIGFGGASIGNLFAECTHQTAMNVVNTALDTGISYFDTAPEYGYGLSERRLGDALRDKNNFVLSTKVGELLRAKHNVLPPDNKFIGKIPFHLHYDYTYDGIMRGFEDSLQRLGLHHIDMVLVHDLDPVIHDAPNFSHYFRDYVDSGYKALHELKQQGVIHAIGLGVKKWEVCERALAYGDYDCFMLQGNYTLLEQDCLDTFLQTCLQKKISILLAGPYASGILATGANESAYYHHRPANHDILTRVKLIEEICRAYNTAMKAVALQFPLKHPAIASVVIGSAAANEIHDNIKHWQSDIPASLWDALKTEKIIPNHAPV